MWFLPYEHHIFYCIFHRNTDLSPPGSPAEQMLSLLLAENNIAKSEQSSHTPGGSHQRPYHFNWREGKIDK